MRICVVGAGAVGGVFAVGLGAAGHEVAVLARGAALSALKEGPFVLETPEGARSARVRAFEDPGPESPPDLLILTLKGPALPALAPRLLPLIGKGTVVLPAMNGVPWWFLLDGAGDLGPQSLSSVDPGGAIAAALPVENVLGCVVHFAATR
jgi:2-dehydropantoate 2-reductase